MKKLSAFTIFLAFLGASRGYGGAPAYDSALAPYPELHSAYDPAVEELLSKIEKNAAPFGALSATVTWKVESARKLDLDRQNFGPHSLKSSANWHLPPEDPGYWPGGVYFLQAFGRDFRIEKPEDALSPRDWWQKDGEHIYARAWSEDWVTIWRFHHDALEAGMLGYPEGLCLLLLASAPGEYMRRADYLERGEKRRWNGGAYETLVATPSWLRKPLFLENRRYFPFNESTLISWANLRPVITYLIDVDRGLVVGAEFVYYRVLRDSPNDWHAGAKPSGLVITCFSEEIAKTPQGTWYPVRIVSELREGDAVLRRTELAIELGEPPSESPLKPLPEGKRKIDPWPKYRSEVYRKWLEAGGLDHANRLGYAASLAYEGTDLAAAEAAIADAIKALEADPSLKPETFGGIDWEFGFALYELFWRYSEGALSAFFDTMPRTETWLGILNRAIELYGTYRGEEDRNSALREAQKRLYALIREPDYWRRAQLVYLEDLERRASEASSAEERGYFQGLAAEVRAALAR